MKSNYDVVILGGGIMGLLSAYELSKANQSVLVIDKSTIGNKSAGSSGITRSLRNDYKDPRYSVLARKAWDQWTCLERELSTKLLIKTGCLNIASDKPRGSYAAEASRWLKRDGNESREHTGVERLKIALPQFANLVYAVLDVEAGIGLASKAVQAMAAKLQTIETVDIIENCEVRTIRANTNQELDIRTDQGDVTAHRLVVAAGLGSADILRKVEGNSLKLELQADKPIECLYYKPKAPAAFTSDKLPIFANLDLGVYGHPIVQGVTSAVKIGMYAPPEIVTSKRPGSISNVREFVEKYLPDLAQDSEIFIVTDTDQCAYDMTPDGNFVIGALPDNDNIIIATGFCGTGFKFAPMTAEIVRRLAIGQEVPYDISAFTPGRFRA